MTNSGIPQCGSIEGHAKTSARSGGLCPLAIGLSLALFVLPIGSPGIFRASAQSVSSSATSAGQATPAPASAQNVAVLEAAVKANPTPTNRLSLSLIYIKTNQPERALPILLSLVAEDKGNASAWNDLCVVNTLRGLYTFAADECNRAIVLEPNNQLARNNLKWAEDEQKKSALAISDVPNTHAASQETSFYLAEGLSQLNAGHPDAAIVSWQRVFLIDPKNAIAANNIGDAYMVKKQPDTALQWFVRASLLDPNLQLAKNNMVWAIAEKAKKK